MHPDDKHAEALEGLMAGSRCGACGRRFTDPRHDHPHDYVGPIEAFLARKPCLACSRIHDSQPDAPEARYGP